MLYEHDWEHCGGLKLNLARAVKPGRMRNYWGEPHPTELVGPTGICKPLRTDGPHFNIVSLMKAHLEQYLTIIQGVPSFAWLINAVPQLWELHRYLDGRADLESTRCTLMHNDIQFGNIMCDPETAQITGLLNWEHSAVLPVVPFLDLDFYRILPNGLTKWRAEEARKLRVQLRSHGNEVMPELFAALDLRAMEPYYSLQQIMLRLMTLVKALIDAQHWVVRTCIHNLKAALQSLDVGSQGGMASGHEGG